MVLMLVCLVAPVGYASAPLGKAAAVGRRLLVGLLLVDGSKRRRHHQYIAAAAGHSRFRRVMPETLVRHRSIAKRLRMRGSQRVVPAVSVRGTSLQLSAQLVLRLTTPDVARSNQAAVTVTFAAEHS